jgi:hypothetical protein
MERSEKRAGSFFRRRKVVKKSLCSLVNAFDGRREGEKRQRLSSSVLSSFESNLYC